MPESPHQWYARVRHALDRDGYDNPDFDAWTAWPWTGELTPRELKPPVDEEPERSGRGGQGCFVCDGVRDLDPGHLIWHDDAWMIGLPKEGSALPFAAFLMPKRHADLQDLTLPEAARQGELLTAIERAACAVLDVPRVQAARWGDGGEHLHWWLYARPTGVLQLRGTFLSHWAMLLPRRDGAELRADLDAVVACLVDDVGGQAIGGS